MWLVLFYVFCPLAAVEQWMSSENYGTSPFLMDTSNVNGQFSIASDFIIGMPVVETLLEMPIS